MKWLDELYFLAPWGGKVRLVDLINDDEDNNIESWGKRLDVGKEDVPDDEV